MGQGCLESPGPTCQQSRGRLLQESVWNWLRRSQRLCVRLGHKCLRFPLTHKSLDFEFAEREDISHPPYLKGGLYRNMICCDSNTASRGNRQCCGHTCT